MNVRNYSLADHTISITTSNRSLIIGNGSSLDTISISFANDNFSFSMSADGSAVLNKNYMLNGTINISLNQANPFVDLLIDLFKSQLLQGVVDLGTIVIKDTFGNINGTFEKCVISKYPDYSAGAESASRDFVILYGKGNLE